MMDDDRASVVSSSSLSSYVDESNDEDEVMELSDNTPEEYSQDHRQNVVLKLLNRERMGCFASSSQKRVKENAFKKVPSRLSFVLKDIIPPNSVNDHVFMGLSQCGKFLLSYKMNTIIVRDDFFESYLYKLYFWIFNPNKPLVEYHHVRLFDLSCNMRHVTIVQWPTNPRYLIVVGTEYTDFSLDSMITIVSVPKIGCSECKILRDLYDDDRLCTQCNLTIHMRYFQYEGDPEFNLHFSLACPNKIVVFSSGQIHAVDFNFVANKPVKQFSSSLDMSYLTRITGSSSEVGYSDDKCENDSYRILNKTETRENSFVAKIIADFADSETECSSQEIIEPGGSNTSAGDLQQQSSSSRSLKHATCKSVRFGNLPIRKINKPTASSLLGNSSDSTGSSGSSSSSASTAYEFSEDTENCEKISTFRKRRLADKRYEFSEDNSENIIPFAKLASQRVFQSRNIFTINSGETQGMTEACGGRAPVATHVVTRPSCGPPVRTRNRFFQNGRRRPSVSSSFSIGSSVDDPQEIFILRRADNRDMPKLQNTSVLSAIQPLGIIKSPTRVDSPATEEKMSNKMDNQACSKRFVRCYVDEDDAKFVSIIDEDDSPGFHSCLPLDVRGSADIEMRMVTDATFEKLKCPGLINTQNTFDLDSFTMIVADDLCRKNQKHYGVFYDWACEIVTVCPLSKSLSCILMVHFTARDLQPNGSRECTVCCTDCLIHVKHYQCRVLFTWDTESGDWNVLEYGELIKVQYKPKLGDLGTIVKKHAQELMANHNGVPPWNNIKILDSYYLRSKTCLTDNENAVEFRQYFDSSSNCDEH